MSTLVKKTVAVILAMMCAFAFCISADTYEDIGAAVSYSVENAQITVSAVTYGNTVITVVPSAVKPGDTNDNALPTVFRTLTSYGRFSDSVIMPDNASGGKYTVYVSTSYGEDSAEFVYINLDEASDTIKAINDEKSITELEKILVNNAIKIGINSDDEVFKDNTRSFANMLSKKDYADIIDFSNTYFEIYPLVALKGKNAKEASDILRQHQEKLGIDYEEDIENEERLSDEEKDILFVYMTEYDFESDYGKKDALSFKEILFSYKSVAALNGAENWVSLKKIITESFFDDFEDMLSDRKYKGLKDKDKVFEIMMKYDYASPEDIEERFEEAVDTRYDKENKKVSSGGSGGSSSGGGVSSGGSFTTSQNIPKPSYDAYKVTFKDISEDFWGFAAIDALASDDIISGYSDGTFRPSNYITRAEFTKLIAGIIKKNKIDIADENESASFGDVSEKDWYFAYIDMAYKKGIILGEGGYFSPQSNIKREDAALIIYRLMDKAGNTPSGIKAFSDREEISEYASSAISALGSIGVVSGGGDGKFMPKNPITRAEAAQLLYNAFEK